MSDWSEGVDDSGDDFGGFDQQAIDRQQQLDIEEANRQLAGDPFATGQGSLTGGTGTLATDPSFLSTIAKALGVKESDLVRMGLFGALGGIGGAALANQPQGVQARGIQQFTRKADIQRPTGAIGTGAGGGGISYFSSSNSQPSEFKFDPSYYLTANPDVNQYVRANLGQFGGDPNRGAYEHFMKFRVGVQRRPSATGALTPFGGLTTTARERPIPLGERYTGNYSLPTPVGQRANTGPATLPDNASIDPASISPSRYDINFEAGVPEPYRELYRRNPELFRGLGSASYAAGGQTPSGLGYLRSAEDGMADRIPATIDNRQPAKLSGGEFVIPADVVSHLGNGNSDAGAKQLHDFMARIRKARTGNQAQGKRIDPAKFFPKGRG